jgi:hypothetical protein
MKNPSIPQIRVTHQGETMKRRLAQAKRTWQLLGWLLLGMGWLALAGCDTIQSPTATLIPTLTPMPLPSATSVPLPTTAIPPTKTPLVVWHSATLENLQGFDFHQTVVGALTAGDLYYVAQDSLQGGACFWANNGKQVGGRDLGSWPETALAQDPLPRDRYSSECIPIIGGHAYVFGLDGDERLAVLRIVDTGPNWVTFEYILRE